jgi:hemolysin III
MLAASAAYNLVAPGHAKALLRRLDHAMIFVMIAGSYTPFALCALPPSLGYPLLVAAWTVAAVGVGLRMAVGNRYRAGFVALYLVHGWMVVAVLRSVAASVQPGALALLVAGGVVYSVGALIMTRERWPFHNAIWHAMVLLAAGLHLGAVAEVLGVG